MLFVKIEKHLPVRQMNSRRKQEATRAISTGSRLTMATLKPLAESENEFMSQTLNIAENSGGYVYCNKTYNKPCGTEAGCSKAKNYCICTNNGLPMHKETKCAANVEINDGLIHCNRQNAKICGNGAACKENRCICTHNGLPMTKDTRCTINIVEIKPSKLPVSISAKNSTNSTTSVTSKEVSPDNVNSSNIHPETYYIKYEYIIALGFVLLFVGITIFAIRYCFTRYRVRFKRRKSSMSKIIAHQLTKPVIVEERYTTNPQYTSSGNPPADIAIGIVPMLDKSSITDLEKIGEGFFGEVFRGQLHSIDNEKEHVETVAIKMLKRGANFQALEDFLREVEIMSSFHHPNILSLVGVCTRDNPSAPWMVFEFMAYGDLAGVLRNSSEEFWTSDPNMPVLTMDDLLSISSQIAAGMEYLAAQRFVHRDLAARNCLVGTGLTVKISDFGMSRDVYTCDYYRMVGNRMLPVRWMSPESICLGKFTLESDIWSYGVLLWEVYTFGLQPYYGRTNEEVMQLVRSGVLLDIPVKCPKEVADIMHLCWIKDPKQRIQFLDICNRLAALNETTYEPSVSYLPRPPPTPITINYLSPFSDDNDNLDDENYLKPIPPSSVARVDQTNIPDLPLPPSSPITIRYPLPFDNNDDDDDDSDDDSFYENLASSTPPAFNFYFRPSNSSDIDGYIETLPSIMK